MEVNQVQNNNNNSEKFHLFMKFAQELQSCHCCAPIAVDMKTFVDVPKYASADIFFVGIAPSFSRTEPGYTFGGKARDVFAEILQTLGLDRNKCYTTNLIKCTYKPVEDKAKTGDMDSCFYWFEAELAILKPNVVVLFGRAVVDKLLGGGIPLDGAVVLKNGIRYFTLPHPMSVVYREGLHEWYFKIVQKLASLLKQTKGQSCLLEFER